MSTRPNLVLETIAQLEASPAGFRCSDLKAILRRLHFTLRDGGRGGHVMFTHVGLPDFHGSSFNCGHRSTASVLSVYVKNIAKILRNHESELQEYLDEQE